MRDQQDYNINKPKEIESGIISDVMENGAFYIDSDAEGNPTAGENGKYATFKQHFTELYLNVFKNKLQESFNNSLSLSSDWYESHYFRNHTYNIWKGFNYGYPSTFESSMNNMLEGFSKLFSGGLSITKKYDNSTNYSYPTINGNNYAPNR